MVISALLVLLLILLGFAIMLGGARGARALVSVLLAPFACLGKTLFALLFVTFGILILATALLQWVRPRGGPRPQPTSRPSPSPLPKVAFRAPWGWPLATEDAGSVGQGYAEYGIVVATQYHAGLDIAAPRGTVVQAPADGAVVKVQRDFGWYDHGLGNTVLTRHSVPGGGLAFALFAHLDKIDAEVLAACGATDSKTGRALCSPAVPLRRADQLGTVGDSGSAQGIPHLHFEVRNFDTLGIGGDDASGEEVGYTDSHPDEREVAGRRFADPMLSLDGGDRLPVATRVVTTDAVRHRVGPGGRRGTEYRVGGGLDRGQVLEAIGAAPPTTRPACLSAWYRVRLPGGQLLPDARYASSPGASPPASGFTSSWVCGDYLARQ